MGSSVAMLWETLQAAAGTPYDERRIPGEKKSPGDHEGERPREASEKGV